MQPHKEQIIAVIVAIAIILLFIGILFIIMLFYYQQKKRKAKIEKENYINKFNQQLLQAQVEAQEQIRLDIGEELHDNIGALSSLIKINLSLITMSEDENKKNDLLQDSKLLIGKLITDVKQLAKTLNTNKLHQLNIAEVITEDISRLQRMQLFNISLEINGDDNNIANDKKIILYRICQELLHNIVKHANAKNVLMQLTFTQQHLHIFLQDDGEGFDLLEAKQKKLSTGLLNLYNRTQLIGGTLTIDSQIGKGTITNFYIPAN